MAATPKQLDNAVKYIRKLKLWLRKQQTFNRDAARDLNRLKRKVFKTSVGGPAPINPPPPPPFKP